MACPTGDSVLLSKRSIALSWLGIAFQGCHANNNKKARYQGLSKAYSSTSMLRHQDVFLLKASELLSLALGYIAKKNRQKRLVADSRNGFL